jgi:poly(ADP-ribose) glycohydrolase ARH3
VVDRPALDRFRGALLGALVGDCLGAPFEGHQGPVPRQRIEQVLAGSDRLRYTDDTAMTIALAESLVERGGVEEEHVATTFAAHFGREPWRGYGGGARRLLARIGEGAGWRVEAAAQFGGTGSFGNGAAMRVAPVGCHAAGDPVRASVLARRTAAVTHAHPMAGDGAAVQAAAVATLVATPTAGGFDVVALVEAVSSHAATDEVRRALDVVRAGAADGTLSAGVIRERIGTGVSAAEAVPAAVGCFATHLISFTDAVVMAIGLGGDTDTIASMAGALAGARLGDGAIPAAWIRRVEGAGLVRDLADRLYHVTGSG